MMDMWQNWSDWAYRTAFTRVSPYRLLPRPLCCVCIKLCKQNMNWAVIICENICMVSHGYWVNTLLHWTCLGKQILVLSFPMLCYSNTDRNSPTTIDLQHNLVLYMGPFSGPRSVHKKSVTNGLPPHLDLSNMRLVLSVWYFAVMPRAVLWKWAVNQHALAHKVVVKTCLFNSVNVLVHCAAATKEGGGRLAMFILLHNVTALHACNNILGERKIKNKSRSILQKHSVDTW